MNLIRSFFLAAILLVTSALVNAQTSPDLQQLKSLTPGLSTGTILVITAAGKLSVVNLGPCFALSTTTPLTLQFNPTVSGCAPTQATVPNYSDAEIPGGLINGTNPTFTLAHFDTATGNSVQLFRNGILQQNAANAPTGVNPDYSISSTGTITFVSASIPACFSASVCDYIQASYRY